MGIAAFGVVGGDHVCGHGLSEAAGTGDTQETVFRVDSFIQKGDEHGFVDIVLAVPRYFQSLNPWIDVCSHIHLPPMNKYSIKREKAVAIEISPVSIVSKHEAQP